MGINRAFIGRALDDQIGGEDDRFTGRIYEKIISITSAEIKLLVTVPKLLVAAPGLGKVLEFVSAMLFLDYTAPAYTANTSLTIQTVTGDTPLSCAVTAANFLDLGADTYTIMAPLDTVAGVIADVNDGLELVAIGVPATGNSTMKVKVTYRIHDFN